MIDKREFMRLRMQFLEVTTEFGDVLSLVLTNKNPSKEIKDKWGWVWKLSKEQCASMGLEVVKAVEESARHLRKSPVMYDNEADKEAAYEQVYENMKKLLDGLNAKFSTWQMMSSLGIKFSVKDTEEETKSKADNSAA